MHSRYKYSDLHPSLACHYFSLVVIQNNAFLLFETPLLFQGGVQNSPIMFPVITVRNIGLQVEGCCHPSHASVEGQRSMIRLEMPSYIPE